VDLKTIGQEFANACATNDIGKVKFLLAARRTSPALKKSINVNKVYNDPNASDNSCKSTYLIIAIYRGYYEIVKLLLEVPNIDVDATDTSRTTALILTCLYQTDEYAHDKDLLYMTNTELGGALSSFAEAVDWKGEPFTASFKQAMIGFSVDDFVSQFNPLFPNHIKIDVDGIENKIIKGAKHTLSDKRVKSILVELDSNRESYCKEVMESIEQAGLKFITKKHGPMLDNCQFSDSYNYIFMRPLT